MSKFFKNLAKISLIFIFAVSMSLLSIQKTQAQSEVSMSVSLNSDAFFGFYPFFAGAYEGGDVDFTFYGILWSGGTGGPTTSAALTSASFTAPATLNTTSGSVAGWGNWTEFGVGIGIPVGDALYINPQLGLLSGGLLSGTNESILGEGIVPNLTVLLDTDALEGELYAGYYLGLVHNPNVNTNDFLHWWLTTGYKVSSFISFGAHLEHLRFMGGQEADGVAERDASDVYITLGPYVKFSGTRFFGRFSTGWNVGSEDNALNSFYKVSVGYSF